MFKHLRIKNFKGWQDTGNIDMAPITLFFGANSSGKSSIGQFLMMLKQTIESSDRKAILYPGDKNSVVQLGSYQDMVFGQDQEKNIEFEYKWLMPDNLNIKDAISGFSCSGESLAFEAAIGRNKEQQHTPTLDRFKYTLMNDGVSALTIGMKRGSGKRVEYDVEIDHHNLLRKTKGRAWRPRTTFKFYGFPNEVVAYHQNADFVRELNLRHENLFSSLSYLGPLRTKTDRLYSWAGAEPESVGYAGENTISAILAAQNRYINFGFKQHTKSFQEAIALKLKAMELIDEFKVNPISDKRKEYEIKVRTKGSKNWVDLPDVGFGVSQVLPVLVQCFYAQPDSIILMEQPEIHLHPSAQSALADVMIDVIHSREDGEHRNIQLIIETHSEHFLRRLQRRVAEGKISHEKVAAYFADTTKQPATLNPLEIDDYGSIRNWPKHFFGDEMGDIVAQSEAAMAKRKRELMAGQDNPE